MRGLFISLAFLISALPGCEYYREKPLVSDGFKIPQVNTKTVSFRVVSDAVFSRKCIACHGDGSPSGIFLTSYGATIQNLGKIERAIFSDSMPKSPSRPLSGDEKQVIRTWLDAGAPETAQGELPTPTPVLEPKFTSIRKLVFEAKCTTCHSQGGAAEKVPLIDYQELLGSPRDLVLPKNPDESGLVIAIERQDNKRMPPPESGNPLSNEEMMTIRKWIEDGAQNN